jgi:hypothetical protein
MDESNSVANLFHDIPSVANVIFFQFDFQQTTIREYLGEINFLIYIFIQVECAQLHVDEIVW